jgi:hypothetical protein
VKFKTRDMVSDLIIRFCPYGHRMTLTHYVWANFLLHRCKSCKTLYNYNELTETQS